MLGLLLEPWNLNSSCVHPLSLPKESCRRLLEIGNVSIFRDMLQILILLVPLQPESAYVAVVEEGFVFLAVETVSMPDKLAPLKEWLPIIFILRSSLLKLCCYLGESVRSNENEGPLPHWLWITVLNLLVPSFTFEHFLESGEVAWHKEMEEVGLIHTHQLCLILTSSNGRLELT